MSRARDLASNFAALDALASDATALGALADIQAMLTARGVGTVSEVGGVPTGAIVQFGSDATGAYIRLADGTQICWGGITSSSAGHVTWTYPQPFTDAPRITATCIAAANARIPVYSNATGTSAAIGVYSTGDALVDNIFTSVMAMGRWY